LQLSNAQTPQAPLVLDQCGKCDLVQLRHTVDPKILYQDHYWYQSGINAKLKDNLLDIANIANTMTDSGDVVLDIGANDGTLLSGVDPSRLRVGCEPASNLIPKLTVHADVVIPEMWDHVHMNGKLAKVITAIGMFYDMDNPNQFIRCVKETLQSDGVFIAQLMTLAPMLKMYDVGNICHEHLEYYSYNSLVTLYEQNGLEIFKVIENDIQGGSYQIWARHYINGSMSYQEDLSSLNTFAETITYNGNELRQVLRAFKDEGLTCYVYGASTKGNTMLQLWNLYDLFDGAAEIHPDKIGRFTVGTNIPIISEENAREKADVFFVPNFGFKDMFVEKEADWIARGGKMVFAMPTVHVVNK
jgi:NDP-4-keto-2,6-dideoxyhexose 3-C-methyltransferase